MQPIRASLWGCLLVAALGWGAGAPAQTGRDGQLIYELINRMQVLEQEVRELRGELEVQGHRQAEAARRLEARIAELERMLGATPGGAAAVAPEGGPPGAEPSAPALPDLPPAAEPAPEPPPIPPTRDERAAYEMAYQMLVEGRYRRAQEAFESFLEAYPDGSHAASAQYWLGETHYVTRDFAAARDAFLAMGTGYPSSDKLPDAMLKLGYSYYELNDRTKAREVLEQLVDAFPDTQAARRAERRLEGLR